MDRSHISKSVVNRGPVVTEDPASKPEPEVEKAPAKPAKGKSTKK